MRSSRTSAITMLFLGAVSFAPCAPLHVDPVVDAIVLGTGLAAAAGSELLIRTGDAPAIAPADLSLVNAFDRAAIFHFSSGNDTASTVLQYATVAVPALFAAAMPFDQLLGVAVLYGEVLSYAYAAKNIMKYFFPRYRPFVYVGDTPQEVDAKEWYASFPSGHTTMAFAAATFGLFIFARYFPDSPYIAPFGVAGYSLAVLTASLRIFSGMHFLTDVVVGALTGIAAGYLVPFLHSIGEDEPEREGANLGVSLSVSPQGVTLRLRL